MQTSCFSLVTVSAVFRTREDDPDPSRNSVLWPDPQTGPWWLMFRWAMVSGRPECVGVDIRSCRETGQDWPPELPLWSQTPPTLTWEVWRSLPVPTIVRDLRQHFAQLDARWWREMAEDPAMADNEGDRMELRRSAAKAEARVAGATALPSSVYEEVARVYREAWQAGDNPTQAVATHFTLTASAAAKRVMRARQAGLLPATRKGKGGAEMLDATP